jgi:hypothetical protein
MEKQMAHADYLYFPHPSSNSSSLMTWRIGSAKDFLEAYPDMAGALVLLMGQATFLTILRLLA